MDTQERNGDDATGGAGLPSGGVVLPARRGSEDVEPVRIAPEALSLVPEALSLVPRSRARARR